MNSQTALSSSKALRAFALGAIAALAIVGPSGGAETVPAQADAFVNSIGVDAAFSYRRSPENTAYQAQRDALIASGIRHRRDGLPRTDAQYLEMQRYFGEHGNTHTLGIPVKTLLEKGAPFVQSTLALQAPYVDAVEADNEYDNSGDPDWVAHLRAAQQILYDAVKSSPYRDSVTVLAPSLSAVVKSAPLLGPVPADAGNLHNATCNDLPTSKIRSISFENVHAGLSYVSGGKPTWLTETGYDNDENSSCYISPDAAARYVVTTLAERWNAGEHHIYFDFWSDQTRGRRFGVMGMVDVNGAPKPQYQALKNSITLLSDKGPNFSPQALDYALANGAQNVHTTLLQKRNGTYYMLLWLDVPSWDRHNSAPLLVPPQTVSISLPASITGAKIYRYASDWSLQPTRVDIHAHSIAIPVTASVSFLELRP